MLGTKIVLNKKNAKDDCRILKIPSFIDRPQTKKIRSIRVTILPLFFIFCSVSVVSAQSVGINTLSPDASAALDITSTTQGFLPPRMTATERDNIVSSATGLVIYNTTTNTLEYKTASGWVSYKDMPDGTAVGAMNYWNGTNWVSISPGANGEVLKFINNAPAWASIGTTYYLDADNDGYGDSTKSITYSTANVPGSVPIGYLSNNTDCDDTDATVNIATQTWFIDSDRDGYGVSSTVSCSRPTNGFLLSELLGTGTDDCDDADTTVNIVTQTWFIDSDGDGYGASSIVSCARPTNGFLLTELSGTGTDDCNDMEWVVNPGTIWYIDEDGDGYGSSMVMSCTQPIYGTIDFQILGTGTDDCNDTDAAIKPTTVWYSPNSNEYYHQCNSPTAGAYVAYFYPHSNNVTCMCPDAAIGSSGTVNGVTYTKRGRAEITLANAATTCTSGIDNMFGLFSGNASFNADISSWDTSSVISMKYMFRHASNFNQNIGNWDTSNVTDMAYMFESASAFNQDLSGWCVSYISTQPSFFNTGTNSWTLPQPVWGTCPQ